MVNMYLPIRAQHAKWKKLWKIVRATVPSDPTELKHIPESSSPTNRNYKREKNILMNNNFNEK